jgi:glycosyltransferase involved in cell wall biosynthesis
MSLIFLNILFYSEPQSAESGPDSVSWHLSKILSKKVNLTYVPRVKYDNSYLKLIKILQNHLFNKYDILHFAVVPVWRNGSYLMLNYAIKQKTPVILNIHGLMEVEHALEPSIASISKIGWSTSSSACRLANKVVVNSEYMKTRIALSFKISPDKIAVVPNGVNFRELSNCESQIKLSGDPAIISVGRVCKMKGFETIINAVDLLRSELPGMKIHFIGPVNKEYFDLARNKQVDNFLIFHGKVPHSTIPSYLKSSDFGIFASTVYEGFGVALIEAMASGLPVIASDIDTYRQIITNEKDGLLFRKNNPSALSEAILRLSQDSNLKKRLSKNSQITALKYDWNKIAEKYVILYKSLC